MRLVLTLFVSLAMLINVVDAQENRRSAPTANELSQHLQDISVTIKSSSGRFGGSEGSGVLITRELVLDKEAGTKTSVNFVWTAGHVIDNLRTVRTVIKDGKEHKLVEFKDAQIVKELVEHGRRVGELKMDAKVIKYSDADHGEDLALLMVRKKNFVTASADFFLDRDEDGHHVAVVPIGTPLFHVGSLLGQSGSNSMTSGIVSQVGRVLALGSGDGVVFDQTTVPAFPGSSGGGVFLAQGENAGKYMGMLVRGAGETFNLVVPVRRMHRWAKQNDVLWALDTDTDIPTYNDIVNIKVEGNIKRNEFAAEKAPSAKTQEINKMYPFLLLNKNTQPKTVNGLRDDSDFIKHMTTFFK